MSILERPVSSIDLTPEVGHPVHVEIPRHVRSPLSRLRALLLLAGSLRPTPFAANIGRSVLDLPWDGGRTVLDLWCEHASALASVVRWERPLIQVLIDQRSPAPVERAAIPGTGADAVRVVVRRDDNELRGTGGLLHDVAREYADDEYLLVAHAAQVLRGPLMTYAAALAQRAPDVGLIAHDDGSPSRLWLIRCGCLRQIPAIGYVDLMEQALPLIATTHDVTVTPHREPTGMPLRTHADYIRALRWHYRARRQGPAPTDPLAEDWEPLFQLSEAGAAISPDADVFDSVVLAGARVESGATVVRCVVCPGGVVHRRERFMNQLVTGGDRRTRA